MKLHAKILNHYLSCSSPVDKAGFLFKKGERNTSYQKRWFTLKGNLLFYKDRPGDRDLIGVIVLEGCSVQLCESEEQFAFSLVFSETGLRTYKLAAESQQSQESWIKALLSASHGFLSSLVRDLETQYEEIRRETIGSDIDQRSTVIGPDADHLAQSLTSINSGPSSLNLRPTVREGRSYSTNDLLQAPPTSTKPVTRKSPKLWPKRHAHVTPISGPAPPLGEWPLAGAGPFKTFSELHELYGKEVRELRADWLRKKLEEEGKQEEEEDLIDFG